MHPTLSAAITQLTATHPEGIGLAELVSLLDQQQGIQVNRRTLQRHLQRLIEAGALRRMGESRAAKYVVDYSVHEPEDHNPYLSAAGQAIQAQVRRPRHLRKPVGYQRSFLAQYQPGQTFYLPAALRADLRKMGQMGGRDHQTAPLGTLTKDILGRLMVDLSWASSRLEGNTYSRLDTQNLIEFGQAAQGKDLRETRMILNHKAALELLVHGHPEVGINSFTLFNLHALLSQDLLPDPNASGRLRQRVVEIAGTVYLPLSVPQSLAEQFEMLVHKAAAVDDPYEQAFFLMVHLPYLQPFEDVNKRVSRLAANIPLLKHALCPLSFIDLPERDYIEGILGVYELNRIDLLRDVFVWAYERSCHRYVAIRATTAQPNPLRILYQKALIEVVQQVVRGDMPRHTVASHPNVKPEHAKDFQTMVTDALNHLHEGSLAQFGLSRAEYAAWVAR